MRIISIIICFVFMGIQLTSQDTAAVEYGNAALKLSPFGFARSELQLGWEQFLNNRRISITVTPSVIIKETDRNSKFGYQIMGEHRFYLSHINSANRNTLFGFENYGFYTGLYGLYMDYEEDYAREYYDNDTFEQYTKEHHKTVNSAEGGILLGLVIDITDRILIDINVGGGIRKSEVVDDFDSSEVPYYNDTSSVFDIGYTGVKPKVGFTLGIIL